MKAYARLDFAAKRAVASVILVGFAAGAVWVNRAVAQGVSASQSAIYRPLPRCDSSTTGTQKVSLCAAAIAKDSASVELRLLLADEYVRAGAWSQAKQEFNAAAHYQPSRRNFLRDSLVVYFLRQDWSAAGMTIADGQSFALRVDLQPLTAALVQARVLRAQGRDEEAIPILERATSLNQRDPRLFLELGGAYKKTGRKEQAMTAFRYVANTPGVDDQVAAEAWGSLGDISAHSSRPAIAVFYWDRALSLDSAYFAKHPDERDRYLASRTGSGFSGVVDSSRRTTAVPRKPAPAVRRPKRDR